VFPGPVRLGGTSVTHWLVPPSLRTGASRHSGGDLLGESKQEGLSLPPNGGAVHPD
jgi:hypothetical protein